MIRLDHVSKVFRTRAGEIRAVDDVSLEIAEGETLCLIGTSGSGKTTTMRVINRLEEPSSGEVRIGGEPVAGLDPIKLRRRIGYVIQRGGLFPHMTAGRNIGLLCELEGWDKPDIEARVGELLELVNLPAAEYASRRPRALSGGQQQRVGVARALALDPDIILMDEPFGALDPITRAQLHEEFLRLKERVKKTIVVVTHDMAEAFMLGDRVAVMDKGKLIQVGTPDELRDAPATEFVKSFIGAVPDA